MTSNISNTLLPFHSWMQLWLTGHSNLVPPDLSDNQSLVKAHPSIDVWAFGVLVFQMCAGESLFQANWDDDITSEEDLKKLYHWRDEDFETNIGDKISNDQVRRLLKAILRRDPTKRPSMKDILDDDFFHPDRKNTDEILNEIKKTQAMVLENRRVVKEGFSQV